MNPHKGWKNKLKIKKKNIVSNGSDYAKKSKNIKLISVYKTELKNRGIPYALQKMMHSDFDYDRAPYPDSFKYYARYLRGEMGEGGVFQLKKSFPIKGIFFSFLC